MTAEKTEPDSFEEELLGDFAEVAEEHIQSVEENLFQLETDPSNMELINEIFRSVHSLKGDAGSLGVVNIKELSHSMENIFDSVRDKKVFITDDLLDLMFDATRVLKNMLAYVPERNFNYKDEEILKKLRIFQQTDSTEGDLPAEDTSISLSVKEGEIAPMEEDEVEDRYVLFRLNGMTFAVEINSVQEVVEEIPSTKVPVKEDYIEGVINLRGTIVPVINLFRRFQFEGEENEETKILIVFSEKEKIGLRIDEVVSVIDIDSDKIEESDHNILNFKEDSFIKGISKKDDDIILFVRLEKILDRNII